MNEDNEQGKHGSTPEGFTDDEWEAGIYMQAYPATPEGQAEFCRKGLLLMRHELNCMIDHAKDDDWDSVVFHLASDIDGMKSMFAAILAHLIEPDRAALIMATLTKEKMEAETGVPMEVVEVAKGVYELVVDAKAGKVPDNIDSLTSFEPEDGDDNGG